MTSKDLISRQAAIDALHMHLMYRMGTDSNKKRLDDWINSLPSAQPELDEWCPDCKEYDSKRHCCPRLNRVIRQMVKDAQSERKKGRWIELTNTNHTYVCSVCGRMLVNITDGKNTVTKNYPFCHCGADMRGEQDG